MTISRASAETVRATLGRRAPTRLAAIVNSMGTAPEVVINCGAISPAEPYDRLIFDTAAGHMIVLDGLGPCGGVEVTAPGTAHLPGLLNTMPSTANLDTEVHRMLGLPTRYGGHKQP